MNLGNLEGLIPMLGGIYGLLLVYGKLPRKPKNPEKLQIWRDKWGIFLKIACPILIIFGLIKIFISFA